MLVLADEPKDPYPFGKGFFVLVKRFIKRETRVFRGNTL
jgi:hypothetical protein